MWKDAVEETYVFYFTQSWPSAKQAQIRRESSNYDVNFLLHTSKLIWGLEMTIYSVWWK